MKVPKLIRLIFFLLSQLALILSCEKSQDPCESLFCQNGGICFEGECDCPVGFAGEFCEFTTGTFTDTRNNQSYPWVILKDGKKWMAENLNYWNDSLSGNSYFYDNVLILSTRYGRLYDWNALMQGEVSSNSDPSNVKGICPDGWHIPSDMEWINMTKQYGGHKNDSDDNGEAAYYALITGGYSGLDLVLGGYGHSGFLSWGISKFSGQGKFGKYWSSTKEVTSNNPQIYEFNGIIEEVIRSRSYSIDVANSCRCVQD